MTRLPRRPGTDRLAPVRRRVPAPPANVHWVRHELTDAGWRWRTVLRHLAIIVPVCAILVVLLKIFLAQPRRGSA